jgi:hypothetical protein
MGEPTPPAPQSNQNAGADAKPCRWCQLWNAAFSASQLEALKYDIIVGPWIIDSVKCGVALLTLLAQRDPGDCKECRRSAEIHRGESLGHEQAEWRAQMWEINPSMRFMMRQGRGDAEFSPRAIQPVSTTAKGG